MRVRCSRLAWLYAINDSTQHNNVIMTIMNNDIYIYMVKMQPINPSLLAVWTTTTIIPMVTVHSLTAHCLFCCECLTDWCVLLSAGSQRRQLYVSNVDVDLMRLDGGWKMKIYNVPSSFSSSSWWIPSGIPLFLNTQLESFQQVTFWIEPERMSWKKQTANSYYDEYY